MARPISLHSFFRTYTPSNIYRESRYRLAMLGQKFRGALRQPGSSSPVGRIEEHPASVGAFYDTNHESFLRVYGLVIQALRTRNIENLLDHQLAEMDLRAGQTVLDAGCGLGWPAIYFARKAGVRVDAITISRRQYEDAALLIEREHMDGSVRVVCGDYHHLDQHFPRAAYDAVYFLESFGHSRAKQQLLDSCWSMLKPGGLLYIKDLFRKIPLVPAHAKQIDAEVRTINQAYCYEIAELNDVLTWIRQKGYILKSVSTAELKLEDFEDLFISNEFQNLTGIAKIENWNEYVFPVDFFEIKCIRPDYDLEQRIDRSHLQHVYHKGRQPGSVDLLD